MFLEFLWLLYHIKNQAIDNNTPLVFKDPPRIQWLSSMFFLVTLLLLISLYTQISDYYGPCNGHIKLQSFRLLVLS